MCPHCISRNRKKVLNLLQRVMHVFKSQQRADLFSNGNITFLLVLYTQPFLLKPSRHLTIFRLDSVYFKLWEVSWYITSTYTSKVLHWMWNDWGHPDEWAINASLASDSHNLSMKINCSFLSFTLSAPSFIQQCPTSCIDVQLLHAGGDVTQ